jgi:ABC-type multidrug transport system permease subunit
MNPLTSLHRSLVWPMLRKEFTQLRRDRLTFGMMLGIPLLQIVVFGFLVRTEVRDIPLAVVDDARTTESRELLRRLLNTHNFKFVGQLASRDEIEAVLRRGKASAVLVVPPEFSRDIARGTPASAQLVIDASDPLTASSAISGAATAALATQAALTGLAGARAAPFTLSIRPRYNPALRDAVNIVPGLIGVILTITLVMIMSLSLVRERERGTLEQLIVTPISKTAVILGKILPFLGIGFVQVTVVLIAARVIFRVPSEGSLLLLYVFALLFMLGMLALGIFMSTLARTQTQALQLSLLVMLPSILLSGFMFPLAAMPRVARIAGSLLPVTHFLTALRGILLKGSGIAALWPQALILTAVALVLITLSIRRFAKTLE